MVHSEFAITLHLEKLTEMISKKSLSNKVAGYMLNSLEIIRQLQKENASLKAGIEDLKAVRYGKPPVAESLADRNCPVCGSGIPWDALNDSIEDAPRFCQHCGQAFDWSQEAKYTELIP